MSNQNNPRPDDQMKKKPMGDQLGQKAQPKGGKDDMPTDVEKNKSNDMKKGDRSDQGQMGQDKKQH